MEGISASAKAFYKHSLPFSKVKQLSRRDIAYQEGDKALQAFYNYSPSLESFELAIKEKSSSTLNRALLHKTFEDQYKTLSSSRKCIDNINLISNENTFTVVTAHQPSLLTGPLYFIYKICSVINLCKTLKNQYPNYNFIPVFVSGGEDHDFEEINHVNIFGQQLVWENNESGSVGNMSTSTLSDVSSKLKELLGDSDHAQELNALFSSSFKKFSKYGAAVQNIVHELFKSYGLLVLDMNVASLKKEFIPLIRREIFENVSLLLVEATISNLEKAGFKKQAHPREINFFYAKDQIRNRLIRENNSYKVVDTDILFSKSELEAEIENHPERFSPNVVMRPIYQEYILPNLAYVGGGGEIAYWLERKEQFREFDLAFPILIRRNSVLFVNKGQKSKLDKTGLSMEHLFLENHLLVDKYLEVNSVAEISLESEKIQISEQYERIKTKAKKLDKSLESKLEAAKVNHFKQIDKIEQRLRKAEKNNHETGLRQINKIQEKLFPGASLQERKDNFIPYYIKHGQAFIQYLVQELNPLNKEFIVIEEL